MELPKLGNTKNPIGAECNGSPSGEKSLETKPTMQRILVGNQGDQYVEKEHVHEKTNIALVWSLSLLFIFVSFLATSLFTIIEDNKETMLTRVLDDTTSLCTKVLGDVTSAAENQAYAVAVAVKSSESSWAKNVSSEESLKMMRQFELLMKGNPKGAAGPDFLSPFAGYYAVHSGGASVGLERADEVCKAEKGKFWCWGSEPGKNSTSDIISTFCSSNCTRDFPPQDASVCSAGSTCSAATTAERYVTDYRQPFRKFFRKNWTDGLATWAKSNVEVTTTTAETYLSVAVPVIKDGAVVDSLGVVDLTFTSLKFVFSRLARSILPNDIEGRDYLVAPVQLGVLEIVENSIVTPILTSYLNTNTTAKLTSEQSLNLDKNMGLFFKSIYSSFPHSDKSTLRVKSHVSGVRNPNELSCRTKKYHRPGFKSVDWLIIVCLADNLELSTFDAIIENFLLLAALSIVSVVLCFGYVHRMCSGCVSRGDHFAACRQRDKSPASWLMETLIPQTLATLAPCITVLLCAQYIDLESTFIARLALWGAAKAPIVHWLFVMFDKTGGDMSRRTIRVLGVYTTESKTVFGVALALWFCTRCTSLALNDNGAIHVLNGKSQKNGDVLEALLYLDTVLVLGILWLVSWQRLSSADGCCCNLCSRVFPSYLALVVGGFLGFQFFAFYAPFSEPFLNTWVYSLPMAIFVCSFWFSLRKEVKDQRFPPLAVQYRVIIAVFYLWVVDWSTAFMSNVISQLRLMMDLQEIVEKNSLPTQPCSSTSNVECSSYKLETVSVVLVIWVTSSAVFGSVIQPIAWRAGGFKLSLASSFALKLLRSLFSGFIFFLIRPFSATFVVFTLLELGLQTILYGSLHRSATARLKRAMGKEEDDDALQDDTFDAMETDLELLLRRMAKGIYYIHAYSLSRLIIIVILLLADSFGKLSKNMTAFVHVEAQTNTRRYLASYSFQLALNCIATRLVQESHRHKINKFHKTHSKMKRDSGRHMKVMKKTDSLYWKHLKLGSTDAQEHEDGHEYDFGKSFSVQEITAYMTPIISSMTVFAVMHTLLAYISAYQAISINNVMAQNKSIDSLHWLDKASFPQIRDRGFLYTGCLCQV